VRLMKIMFAAFAALALGASGCGGSASAEDFEGLYVGSGNTAYTTSSGRTLSSQQSNWSESLSASISSEKILFAGFCRITATVTGDRTFTLDANTCSLGEGNVSSSVTCQARDELKSGTGTLSEDGKRLDLTYVGEFVQFDCSDAFYNETFQYTTKVALNRQ
jgi:hypothetical protein